MLTTTLMAATVIHYGVMPKGDPAQQKMTLQPIVRYLEAQTGAKVSLEVAPDLNALIQGCVAGKYDVAHMSGYAYVQVHERAGWLPIVQGTLAHRMHSVFITQTGSDIKNINDLKGKTFAFGDPNSAAEYLMPTYFLDLNNLPARATFKRFVFSKTVAEDLVNYKVDAAVMEEVNYKHALKRSLIAPGQTRVFYITPEFPDNVWACSKSLAPALQQRWSQAFLRLTPKTPTDKRLLDILRAPGFLVPRNEDYAKVREAELMEGLMTRTLKAVGNSQPESP